MIVTQNEYKSLIKYDCLRIRNSVDKLTDKISEERNDQVYLKEETVGVVVTEASGKNASFSVFGDKSNYTQTEVAKQINGSSEPFLFSVSFSFIFKSILSTSVNINEDTGSTVKLQVPGGKIF